MCMLLIIKITHVAQQNTEFINPVLAFPTIREQ